MSMVAMINGVAVAVPREVAAGGVAALEAWYKKNVPNYKKGKAAPPSTPTVPGPVAPPEKEKKGGKG